MPTLKTVIPGLLIAVFAATTGGCAGGQSGSSGAASPRNSGEIVLDSDGLADLDVGQDWDQSLREPGRLPGQPSSATASTSASTTTSQETWAIVLFTFTGPGNRQNAEDGAMRIRSLGPEFASARAVAHEDGSMIVLGSYSSHDDRAAQEELDRLRRMVSSDGRRVFRQVILTRLESAPARLSPYDLRNVRRAMPGQRTLYTVDIAVWSTFDDTRVKFADLKLQAESYATQLRGKGYEAYFYHNEAAQTSNVTIGVFGADAYDAQSGIYSPGVQDVMRQFPVRLNNGQPLEVPIDRFHPERGTRPQSPALVEVP